MLSGLWLLASAMSFAAPAPTPSTSERLILMAKDEAYRKAKGEEVTLDGILERTPPSATGTPPARVNLFRLRYWASDGRVIVRELHAPGKAHLVSSHVDKRIRVLGKV